MVDGSYVAYDRHPVEEPDEWGDLASFRVAVASVRTGTDERSTAGWSLPSTTTRETAMTPADDDLPKIGAPAIRALASIGVTRLEQLGQHRPADLLALHGVGPRALRILGEAMAERGLTFADG